MTGGGGCCPSICHYLLLSSSVPLFNNHSIKIIQVVCFLVSICQSRMVLMCLLENLAHCPRGGYYKGGSNQDKCCKANIMKMIIITIIVVAIVACWCALPPNRPFSPPRLQSNWVHLKGISLPRSAVGIAVPNWLETCVFAERQGFQQTKHVFDFFFGVGGLKIHIFCN